MPSWGEVLKQVRSIDNPHDQVRRHYLRELHDYTGRDVLLYSSGWTHLAGGSAHTSMIDADMQGIMEAFSRIDGDGLDIVIHSPGGSPGAAESIVDYIRTKYDNVRIFIPHAAMSAATMVACAADELVMGRHSFLGPIDPQITLDTPTGKRPVPAAAILSQFDLARKEIEEDESNLAHWTPIIRQYGPGLIQECEQAMDLSRELAQNWAEEYLLKDEDDVEKLSQDLAEKLTNYDKFKSHSRHLHRGRARELGFEISDLEDDDTLQDLVLSVYHAATLTHDNRNVAKIIETHEGNAFIIGAEKQARNGPRTQIQIPDREPPAGPPQPKNQDF